MISYILLIFRPFKWLIEASGANYRQFERILRIKLTMDNRRASDLTGKKGKNVKNALLVQSLIMIFMGSIVVYALNGLTSAFTLFFATHSFLMLFMSLIIISDFSAILLDSSENSIIQPLPIKGNTLGVARNAHILIYLTINAVSIMVVPLVFIGVQYGVYVSAIFLVSIVLNVVFTLLLSNAIYLIIMGLVKGERLKSLLMYAQVGIVIFFMVAYQFGMHFIDRSDIGNMVLKINWHTFLIPPAYFAGFVDALSFNHFNAENVVFLFGAAMLPIASLYLIARFFMPVFNRKLAEIEQGERSSSRPRVAKKNPIARVFATIFGCKGQEKSSFILAWKMAGRERLFLQSMIPVYAYLLLFIILPLVVKSMNDSTITESYIYIPMLYLTGIVGITLPSSMLVGNSSGIGWMFKSLPSINIAKVFKGFIKSVYVKFVIPFYLLLGAISVTIWGFAVLADVVVIFFAVYLSVLLGFLFQSPFLPFSQDKSVVKNAEVIIRFFLLFVIFVGFVILHFYLASVDRYFRFFLLPLYLGGIMLINRYWMYKVFKWSAVLRVNAF